MTNDKVPEQLKWVHARAQCSLPHVFKELEQGARDDAEEAQSLVPERSELRFSVATTSSHRFSVVRTDDPMSGTSRSIDFLLTKDQIEVYRDYSELLYSASLTLNDEGKCRLKVGDKELTQWQFRRTALEKLFFGPFD